ncbi:MAG TPA: LysR family transcriptional regulator [Ramlibacter sp.]|nr:LysR family transcriptional regulator [Ramlibacter sp.]
MLKLESLKTYVLVVETGSFSAAAHRLGCSQPAVSLQIKQLETTVGAKLVERVGKVARPTAAGGELLGHARRLLGAADTLMSAMASHSSQVIGRVSIGTGTTACLYFLPETLRMLRGRYPDLQVLVRTGNTVDFVKAVEDNVLDMALVTLPVRSRALTTIDLLVDKFVAVSPGDMRIPDHKVTPRGLSGQKLVLFDPAANTRKLIDDWFVKGGAPAKAIMELGSVEAIKGMVEAGLGCSIIPAMALPAGTARCQVHSLAPGLQRKLALILRNDKPVTQAMRHVIEALRMQARRRPP